MAIGKEDLDGLVVAGMDPSSYRNCGWAVLRLDGGKIELLEKFTQVFPYPQECLDRLDDVYTRFDEMIVQHGVRALAVERSMGGGMSFVRNNLSETVGVTKLVCFRRGVEAIEISPAHLKKIITGHGRGKKKDIKANVKETFGLGRRAGSEHELDAAAMAICLLVDLGWEGYEVKVPYSG